MRALNFQEVTQVSGGYRGVSRETVGCAAAALSADALAP